MRRHNSCVITFLTRVTYMIVEHVFSIGYILWGKKKKPSIDSNVARFKELTIIKLYSKIDECRSKFNRMLVLAPSSGRTQDSGDEGPNPSEDVLVTDWDRSRESLNGISEGKRGSILLDTLPSHIIIVPWDGKNLSDWKASDKKIYILIVSNQFQVRILKMSDFYR